MLEGLNDPRTFEYNVDMWIIWWKAITLATYEFNANREAKITKKRLSKFDAWKYDQSKVSRISMKWNATRQKNCTKSHAISRKCKKKWGKLVRSLIWRTNDFLARKRCKTVMEINEKHQSEGMVINYGNKIGRSKSFFFHKTLKPNQKK